MQSDPEIATHGDEEVHGGKNRLWMYWISFGVSTLIFLFVTAAMLKVPGSHRAQRSNVPQLPDSSWPSPYVLGFGGRPARMLLWPLGTLLQGLP